MKALPFPSDPAPLTGTNLVLASLALALANFIVVLDITIANVSVPHISGSLAAAPSQGTWVITSYAVAEAISVPLTGWLAGRFGAVRTFLGGLLGFGLFSLLCGLAPNLELLILFRIAQGLCGGPIMPMSQTLLLRIFPKDKAAAAFGLWSMTTVVAPILGPILGGLISDNWSWPWIFFINLPLVAFSAFVVRRRASGHETPTVHEPVDYVGLALLVTWVSALQIMLDKGREAEWFASWYITGLALVALIGFLAFLIWELTERHPIVDLKVLRHRGFVVAMSAQSLAYGVFFAQIVLVPLWLQTSLGYTATIAGYATAFLGVFAVILSPVVAGLTERFDVRALVCFGILWFGLMALWRSTWYVDLDFWQIAMPQLVQGIGLPFFFIGTTVLALGSVTGPETASAAGLLNFMRTLAGAFTVSITTTLWEDGAKVARTDLVQAMKLDGGSFQGLPGLSAEQAREALSSMVDGQSITIATDQVFLLCSAVFVVAAAVIWLAPRPQRQADVTQGH